jgi:3-oxoacyl-[acyl-carrier-protein] synthase-3
MRAERFQQQITDGDEKQTVKPKEAFKAEFLRYMLSDGAGCALLDSAPHPSGLSFRIEQFFHHSFAQEHPPCMVFGGPPGKHIEILDTFKFNDDQKPCLMQDVDLLNKNIVLRCADALKQAIKQGFLGDKPVDWILPHISSHIFFDPVAKVVEDLLLVPRERIWTNLSSVGNVGAASSFLLLWGSLNGPDKPSFKIGDRVLLCIPESGNFSYHFVLLTVVDNKG